MRAIGALRAPSLEDSGLDAACQLFYRERMKGDLVVPMGAVHSFFLEMGNRLAALTLDQLQDPLQWRELERNFADQMPLLIRHGAPMPTREVTPPFPLH